MSKIHVHIHKTKDAGENEQSQFIRQVKVVNEHLTTASRAAAAMSSLKDPGLRKQAAELERLVDVARSYAFKIR